MNTVDWVILGAFLGALLAISYNCLEQLTIIANYLDLILHTK